MKTIIALVLISFSGAAFSDSNFFPDKTISNSDWYIGHLISMKEKPLLENSQELVFRFTWLPTFHPPMAFRLEKNKNGEFVLYTKRTNGAGGYGPGKLNYNTKNKLLESEATDLLKKIDEECNFWNMPSRETQAGLDGSQWIFEYKKFQQYHGIDRWSPENGCMYEVGMSLMKLSKAKISKVY